MPWAIFSDEHRRAIAEILQSNSERIVAIVGVAMLDDTIRRTLSERFRYHKDTQEKLFKVGGALGNTEPKIDVLFLLHAFDKPVRDALYGLTQIRNFFAHNIDASFDSSAKKMIDAKKLLTLHVNAERYPHHLFSKNSAFEIEPVRTERDKFIVNLKLCLIALMRDRVSHATWSNTPLSEDQLRARMQIQDMPLEPSPP